MGSTKVELVEDLKAKLKDISPSKRRLLREIIANAKLAYYHDFESPLTTPKMQLHMDLLKIGLKDIDQKMQHGDYDEPATSEQSKELMDELTKDIMKERREVN